MNESNFKMPLLKHWFEHENIVNDENYEIRTCDNDCLLVENDTAMFEILPPHDGLKWLLRIAPISGFDRWSNSTAIEEWFESAENICNYLHENQTNIYKTLLKYLSSDYDEIYNISLIMGS